MTSAWEAFCESPPDDYIDRWANGTGRHLITDLYLQTEQAGHDFDDWAEDLRREALAVERERGLA